MKKCIKAGKTKGRNWRKTLQAILRNYRTTPHSTTGVVPAVLLLKRPVCNKLPQANHKDPVSEIIREHDSSQKSKIKLHADNKTYVKPCTISTGETVLVKRPFSVSKGGSVYNPIPLTVVDKKGSMITAKNENRTVTRNSSFFKSLSRPVVTYDSDESRDSGFSSLDNQECSQELPATAPSVHAPDPTMPKLLDQGDLPSSGNPLPVPEEKTRASQSDSQSHLRRSTRKGTPRQILDL